MKKILSLILALSLIVSVAPMSFAIHKGEAVPAVDEDFSAKPGMYFNFSAANWNKEADILKTTIDSIDAADVPEWATTNTDPWRIAGHYNLSDYCITSKSKSDTTSEKAASGALYWAGNGFQFSTTSTTTWVYSGIVLGVYISECGVFTPSVTYQESTNSCTTSFFLAKKSAFTMRMNGYNMGDAYLNNQAPTKQCWNETTRNANLILLGTQSLYSTDPAENPQTKPLSPVQITEPGFYYLYILPRRAKNKEPDSGYTNLYSIEFKPEPDLTADAAFTATQDTGYDSATAPTTATVKTLALYGETSGSIDTKTVNYGESIEIPAVNKTYTDEAGDTYNFLYWAKGLDNGVGNKHIISTSNEKFSYKPHEGNNYLIAVYEKAGAEKKAAFYDRNGQLLNLEITDNKLPALPAMAGLGDAIGWEQLGTGEVFAAEHDISALEGDKVFMAKYNALSENITISINGVSDTYKYGDPVTCESDDEDFSYWEKTVNGKKQIVSIDKTYTFKAWESCTITAVCNGSVSEEDLGRAARKILFGTFTVGNQTAVMAEFIGFGDAKEKGIMFGEKKIAMTTDYAQFTVTNDTTSAVTVTGYAIVDESGETVKYTDGSIDVAGVTTVAAE